MSDPNTVTYRIQLGKACFGIVSYRGYVQRAAPIAYWTRGKSTVSVLNYYERRGATVERIKEHQG